MATYGYVRVSTPQQSIERQIRNIRKEYPDVGKIYEDRFTGTTTQRDGYQKLRKRVRDGDIVIFDSVSRMSRTAEAGVHDYIDMMNSGVRLVFLKEPHINTDTYKKAKEEATLPRVSTGSKSADEMIAGIMSAIEGYMQALLRQQIRLAFEQSEKEVMDLRERTREGIETARLAGKTIGRPCGSGHGYTTQKEKDTLPLIEKLSRSFGGVLTDTECMKTLGLSHATFYKYKKKIKEKSR